MSIAVFNNFFPWDCLKLCGQWFQYPLGRLHLLRLSQRYLQKPFFIFLPEIIWLVCLTVSKTIWLFSWYIKPLGVPSKTKFFCNVENVYNFLKIFWINCAIISLIVLKTFKKYNLVRRNVEEMIVFVLIQIGCLVIFRCYKSYWKFWMSAFTDFKTNKYHDKTENQKKQKVDWNFSK